MKASELCGRTLGCRGPEPLGPGQRRGGGRTSSRTAGQGSAPGPEQAGSAQDVKAGVPAAGPSRGSAWPCPGVNGPLGAKWGAGASLGPDGG